MSFSDEFEARFDELVEAEVLQVHDIDEEGNVEYVPDLDRLQAYDPDLYHLYMDDVDGAILSLFSKGLVDIDFTQEEISVSLTEKGQKWAEVARLSYPE